MSYFLQTFCKFVEQYYVYIVLLMQKLKRAVVNGHEVNVSQEHSIPE